MPSVKISELPVLNQLSANNANTVFVAVDKTTNTTSQFSTTTLAAGLFANNVLNVGTQTTSAFPGLIAQFVANTAPYGQVNFENANTQGSMDLVMTADIGDDANNYLDLGINNSVYADPQFSATKAVDGYLIVHGSSASDYIGNLVLGTAQAETNVLFAVGGTTNLDVVAKMTKNGLEFDNGGYITFDDGSTQTVAASPSSVTLAIQANTIITQGVDATQNTRLDIANTRLDSIETVNNNQNTSISIIQGVDLGQNTTITAVNNYAASGYAKANAALANATGTFAGDLTITGGLTVANTINGSNVSITNQIQFTSNASIRTASGTSNEKDIVILTGDELTTGNGGSITVQTGVGPLTGRGGNINLTAGSGGLGRGVINLLGDTDVGQRLTVNGTFVLSNTNFAATEAAFRITAAGSSQTTTQDGTLIQLTNKPNIPARMLIDSFGTSNAAYSIIAGRAARGTVDAPTATQNNDILLRIAGNSYGTTGYAPFGDARIDFIATENHSDTARGSRIRFWNTPNGSNVVNEIASFNADSVYFTGVVEPEKGFIFTPRLPVGNQTAITIDFTSDVIIKANLTADLTVTLSNFVFGKVVEVWLTNTGGLTRTITHGCSSINSSVNATTFTMSPTSSAYLRYFSIDGNLANTFVAIQAS
jgi:hypothetical protein